MIFIILTFYLISDIESVLTFQTKLQGCTHIFLGKCVSPPSRNKLALLKLANNMSTDMNARTARCKMESKIRPCVTRLEASSCLDISTVS